MTPPEPSAWIDLTLPLSPGMPVYPGDPPVQFEPHSALERDGFRVTTLELGTHTGTHLDAPSHFLETADTVDVLPLAALVGPARVVDASDVPAGGVIGRVRFGAIQAGERVIVRTGWGARFGEPGYYEEFPSLAMNLVMELAQRPVALIGLETPSLITDHRQDAVAHRELLGAEVVIVEGLTGLERLPEQIWLVALPLRLKGLDGAPCRVIACPLPPPRTSSGAAATRVAG
jgi:kynurenine formamidase